jgi:class 3 adenylate cyclase
VICAHCGAPLPVDARFCPACAAPIEAPPTEERKLATVLFADLVGSTELGSAMDPERTRALLERFYDAMSAEIEGAGGTVEKFVGDAVMAGFGAPAAQEDHAERALHAAISMQRRLGEIFGDRLELRIGVETGEVVVGRPREGGSFVTGDAVNVAARLEQAAASGETLVGERTVGAVGDAFEFGEPVTVEAKGKVGGVACRRLLGSLSRMRPRGVAGMRQAFVGRDGELEKLRAAYRSVAESGEPRLVLVLGDAGVGKTTLVRAAWQRLAEESPEPLRRTGRCLPYGRGITYWPLGEVLKEHFGIRDSDPSETAERRLRDRRILGLTLGLDVGGGLHPLAARDRLHDSWVDFLDELAAERPAVLFIEDLHWAEDDLFDLLDTVMRQVSGPLLLVATARPELVDRRPGFGAGRRSASQIWLDPLGHKEAERMLETLLEGDFPAGLSEMVIERAEGNPFFVEELLATLIDEGVLRRSDRGWVVGDLPAGFRVPDTVQAVLAARIDLLQPAEKAALQAASVIGRVFWTGPVYELLEGVEPDFRVLEERDFIRRRPGSSMMGEREYTFKHALTREVAHESLPKATRARLHAVFARWLERAGEGRDEHAPLLAHHYAEACRPEDVDLAWAGEEAAVARLREKAVRWLGRAARLALGRYEIDDALSLFNRALELEKATEVRSEFWREIGHAHALRYEGEAFLNAMEASLEASSDRATLGDTYSLLAFQTAVRSGMWRRRPATELVDGWIEQALTLAEPDSPARARALLARSLWSRLGAEQAAVEAGALAERLGDRELASWAISARVTSAHCERRFHDAWAWAQRQFDVLDEIDDPDHIVEIHQNAVPACAAVGRFDEARRIAAEGNRLAARLSAHHRVHGVALLLEVEELAGGWDAIRALTARAEEVVRDNVDTPCARNQRSLLVCASACAILGDATAAVRLESAADDLGMEGYDFALLAPRLRLALVRGELVNVGETVEVSTSNFLSFGVASTAARLDALAGLGEANRVEEETADLLRPGTYLEAIALRALGTVRKDRNLLRRALARFDAMGLAWHSEQTRSLLR